MADAADAWPVDAGFDCQNLSRDKCGGGKTGVFVDFEAQAMTSAMEEPPPASLVHGGRESSCGKVGFDQFMDIGSVDARFDRFQG